MPCPSPNAGHPPAACAAAVTAHAMVAARLSEMPTLRTGGWPAGAPSLPARFLRHTDEQTVVGMHAVLAAIASLPDPRPPLDGDGVIAASCQAGRLAGAHTLVQAKRGGGVTVSTQVVPQCSLHSPAGAVSVGLGMHGPNIGVSGGPEALSEGLLTAFSWLHGRGAVACGRVWLIVTGWDDEPALDDDAAARTDPICRAVAVALTSVAAAGASDGDGFVLRMSPSDEGFMSRATDTGKSLLAFGQALAARRPHGEPLWSHRCPWGMAMRLESAATPSMREAA